MWLCADVYPLHNIRGKRLFGQIVLENVACTGNEASLSHCSHSPTSDYYNSAYAYCPRFRYAGVRCFSGKY